ncbi:peptide chain release factor N(5)-glutamine methyltransferase [Deinococcus fonticola]|uniref:peptide chain release factor N(5)-glutamine methyltransferase n=1 Tax=Deinococcus fonticola TaxID=2528713 RepID=UPI001074C433|nr:peptide chain release factor N(5)-glutamine methyltransferase [Deinococcus fonticola]
MLTLRQLVLEAVRVLEAAEVPSPEVDARELVLFALGLGRTALLTRAHEEMTPPDTAKVMALVQRRAARIPLQHLLGEVEWGGVRLKSDARALVPRPETEVLLELALTELATTHSPPARVLDIGTGTGAIALGIKRARPDAEVWATDLSAAALELARENAEWNGLTVNFAQGSLFDALVGPFDLIVSNPPYLPESDRLSAQPEVRHDPALALYSGPDGLDLPRQLVRQAASFLSPGGTLLLELDPRNVTILTREMPDWHAEVLPDLTGRRRFLRARR